MLATNDLEADIVKELNCQAASRLHSQDLSRISLTLFLDRHAKGQIDDFTLILLRLGIKAHPEAANAPQMIEAYHEIVRTYVARHMPALSAWIAQCAALTLPLPVIIACEKYLNKAKALSREFTGHFFGVKPVIIIGGPRLSFDIQDEQVLQIPVSDVYEALPYKIFETWLMMAALGARHGVLKIDDDVTIVPHARLNIEHVRSALADVDYMGVGIQSTYYDRAWHHGKCSAPIAPIYSKPYIAPFANGPLYFLSKHALGALTGFYLRFPGYLAGEFYEDKAVGDLLYRLGFALRDRSIESILGVSIDAPERIISA